MGSLLIHGLGLFRAALIDPVMPTGFIFPAYFRSGCTLDLASGSMPLNQLGKNPKAIFFNSLHFVAYVGARALVTSC